MMIKKTKLSPLNFYAGQNAIFGSMEHRLINCLNVNKWFHVTFVEQQFVHYIKGIA